MTLTVCVGSSGSGKTTFLQDVHQRHKCIYLRQYHLLRPYLQVCDIPNFDPQQLPFWDIYEKEGKDDSITVGGTLAGKFTAGLSGGQRKLLLFELVYQRTKNQSDLIIVLDEPFCGVTDDYVGFIQGRLNEMRKQHNLLIVTNDHVKALKSMADNTITVSAINRSMVTINNLHEVDREQAILALALGQDFGKSSSKADFRFFLNAEVVSSTTLKHSLVFGAITFAIFVATFWNSKQTSADLVLIGALILGFMNAQTYLVALVEWRDSMIEEAEALLHSSVTMNKVWMFTLAILLILLLSAVEFGVVNAVLEGQFLDVKYWVAMLCDALFLCFPIILPSLYTRLPLQTVHGLGTLGFLSMMLFSTTFSPGAGLPVLSELRYAFPRFYFWCMVPSVQNSMEGCPADNVNVYYMILSTFSGVFVFSVINGASHLRRATKETKAERRREELINEEFHDLQLTLYGESVLEHHRSIQKSQKQNGDTCVDEVESSINEGSSELVGDQV